MVHRKGLVRAAAFAALACTGIARAETSVPTNDGLSITPLLLDAAPAAPAAPAPPASAPATTPAPTPTPLMGALAGSWFGTYLDSWGVHIGGYFEGGYTAENHNPPGNVITGRVFDTRHEHVVLDQADFAIDRPVDYGAAAKNHTIDIGAHFEVIYGFDSGLIHSDGLYDNPLQHPSPNGAYYKSRTAPENQFDINQAYLDIALPIGSGLRVRVGKIDTYLGAEVINPTGNAFYSHSYLFGFAVPLTNTGIFGEYVLSPEWLLDGGVTRGENQSVLDNNGSPDIMGEITYTPQGSDEQKKWKVIQNFEIGPEATHDNHDWWTVLDIVASYTASDKLTLMVNGDFGDAPHALATTSGIWYGAAAYATYVINPMFTLNARGEWYQDVHGFTLGGAAGTLNVYEATVGVKITPLPDNPVLSNLVIRPEVRADYADKQFFNGGKDHFQATFGVDAYFIY
jgi:hypothetical protein